MMNAFDELISRLAWLTKESLNQVHEKNPGKAKGTNTGWKKHTNNSTIKLSKEQNTSNYFVLSGDLLRIL